jgi:hypothetical protein
MATFVQASTFTLGTIIVAALLIPPLVVAARKRYARSTLPVAAYGPHLMLLCVIRFVPMFKVTSPQPAASWMAFGEVVAIWASGVILSEWVRNRQLRVRGHDV